MRVAAAVVSLALLLVACAGGPRHTPRRTTPFPRGPATVEQGPAPTRSDSLRPRGDGTAELRPWTRIADPRIDESSGLVRAHGSWWTHNDSGGEPVLYRASTPEFRDAVALRVPGAVNRDWEALTLFQGDLLVCDVGDNDRRRDDLVLHRVRPTGDALETVASYAIAYPDSPHDAEAVFELDGAVHVVVKNRGEPTTDVFRFDGLDAAGRTVGRRVASIEQPPGEQITAGAVHGPSGTVALLSYAQVSYWPASALSGRPTRTVLQHAQQCEALWWDGDDLVFCNEQRDVFRIDDALREPTTAWLPPRPALDLTVLPWTREATTATQPRTELLKPLPLVNARPGDHVRWALAGGDTLYLDAHLALEGSVQYAAGDDGRPGSGLLLTIAREPDLRIDGDDFQLAMDLRRDGRPRVRRIDLGGGEARAGSLSGATWKGAVRGDTLWLSVALPLTSVFGRDVPDTFLVNLCGVNLGRSPEPVLAGHSIWSLLRPYVSAPVRIVR